MQAKERNLTEERFNRAPEVLGFNSLEKNHFSKLVADYSTALGLLDENIKLANLRLENAHQASRSVEAGVARAQEEYQQALNNLAPSNEDTQLSRTQTVRGRIRTKLTNPNFRPPLLFKIAAPLIYRRLGGGPTNEHPNLYPMVEALSEARNNARLAQENYLVQVGKINEETQPVIDALRQDLRTETERVFSYVIEQACAKRSKAISLTELFPERAGQIANVYAKTKAGSEDELIHFVEFLQTEHPTWNRLNVGQRVQFLGGDQPWVAEDRLPSVSEYKRLKPDLRVQWEINIKKRLLAAS